MKKIGLIGTLQLVHRVFTEFRSFHRFHKFHWFPYTVLPTGFRKMGHKFPYVQVSVAQLEQPPELKFIFTDVYTVTKTKYTSSSPALRFPRTLTSLTHP
jgi:hypothetical protein